MTLSEDAFLDSIFETVLKGCDVDVKARKNAIWSACIAMMADCLRSSDEFTRERLLRDLVPELREAIGRLDQLLRSPRNPLRSPRNPLNPLNLN